jgi:hypothetical protein
MTPEVYALPKRDGGMHDRHIALPGTEEERARAQ